MQRSREPLPLHGLMSPSRRPSTTPSTRSSPASFREAFAARQPAPPFSPRITQRTRSSANRSFVSPRHGLELRA
jgi:hypothetical protein